MVFMFESWTCLGLRNLICFISLLEVVKCIGVRNPTSTPTLIKPESESESKKKNFRIGSRNWNGKEKSYEVGIKSYLTPNSHFEFDEF